MKFKGAMLFVLLLLSLLTVGFQNYISTCDSRALNLAFNNRKIFDALRKLESNGNPCKIDRDKLGSYQISKQYYKNSTGNLGE